MTRLPDWFDRLADHVVAARTTPPAYGSNDCFLFAARAIEAQRGVSLGLDGLSYRTLGGGLKALKKRGFADYGAAFASLCDEIAPAFADTGDVGLHQMDDGVEACCVVSGSEILIVTAGGLSILPRARLTRAFRV